MSLWNDSFFQNTNEIISEFLPWDFLYIPGRFLEALFYLWYYLLSPHEAQKASRKPPESYKKFQGRNNEIFSLVFWKKLSFHKDILRLSDL